MTSSDLRDYATVTAAITALLVFAFNIFGDGLRDHLDPRQNI